MTDPQVRARVVDEVSTALTEAGFAVMGVVESPIKGAAGNVEYMVAARLNG